MYYPVTWSVDKLHFIYIHEDRLKLEQHNNIECRISTQTGLKFKVQVHNTGGPVLDLRALLHTECFCYIMQIIIIISKFTLQPNHTLGLFTVLLHGMQDFTTALSYMDSQC